MIRKILFYFLILFGTLLSSSSHYSHKENKGFNAKACKFNEISLYGKVQFVESFPDIKIQFVESFPDIKVKFVSSFPNECGKWQVVNSFPDIKVQIVESFPDIKVKIVESFPGSN